MSMDRPICVCLSNLTRSKMLLKDVESCSFSNWFEKFKKVTFKSAVIPIPPEILNYLRSDDSLVNFIELD